MAAVISLDTQTFLGHNQETYQDLRLAFQLNLRRQLLLAVCDDVGLQTQLARKLELDLNPYATETAPAKRVVAWSPMVTLRIDVENPDLVRQVLLWLKQHRLLKASAQTIPAFQILGLEQLTRRSPTLQNKFLASLIHVDALITRLDCRLLVWVPRPWLGKIQQAVPSFWRSRSGLFEFAGDPTPTNTGPISFDVFPNRRSTQPPDQGSNRTSASSVELPPLGQSSQQQSSKQAQRPTSPSAANLWTILREDLTAFEHGAETADTRGKNELGSPAAPAQAPQGTLPLKPLAGTGRSSSVRHPADGAADPQNVGQGPRADTNAPSFLDQPTSPTSAFQATSAAPPFTVVSGAPIPAVVIPPSDESPTALTEQIDGVTVPALEALSEVKPEPAALPLQELQAKQPLVGQPATDLAGLPPELHQDEDLVRLWHYVQTLEAQQAGPLTLSRAYLGVAQLSRDRIEAGNSTEAVLDFAIAVYGKAIPGLLEGDENWCDALNDLASLYWLRSQQARDAQATADWLSLSVEAYQKALGTAKDLASAETVVRLGSNLGTVHSLLASLIEPLANLRQSQKAYELALQYAPAETLPLEYANLQNSLGAVHWRLAQLDQPQHHLHQAILAYSAALRYRNPQLVSLEYAMIQNNLGIAYWSLAQHEHPRLLLEKAIEAYQSALQYRTLDQSPGGYAATNNNLGTAYWDLAQQHSRNLDQRIPCLQKALTAYENALHAAETILQTSPTASLGFDIWATCHSAGVVHDQLAQGLSINQPEQRKHHLQQALQHYLLAYQGWQDNPQQLEVLVAALVYNTHLSFEILGLAGQQAVLSQVPGELLPQILGQL